MGGKRSTYSNASPTLTEILLQAFDKVLSNVHTSMPGQVSKVNSDGTVDVQPAFKRKYFSEKKAVSLPIITNVPVIFPSVQGGWMRMPLSVGDEVQLHFSERNLDQWWLSGGTQDPGPGKRHDIKDAVATPGLHSKKNQIQPAGSQDSLEIYYQGTRVEITKGGKVKVSNGTVELLQVIYDFMDIVKNLATTNAISGVPCTLSPTTINSIAIEEAKLGSLKS